MKNVLLFAALLTGFSCAAFAATPPLAPASQAATESFSVAEQQRLGYCVSLSVNAYAIAGYKLHGDPKEVPKRFYASSPSAHALVPLVDTVYGDKVTDAWSYAGGFYQDCAEQLAKIAPERAADTVFCFYSAVIAATARTARQAGTPKQKVYALYSQQGIEARKIIDAIYAPATVPPEGTELQTWSKCMVPMAAKS
ncbi:MAG TPA: hypothetical protein VGH91_06840 [Gammaproteobacteria bacterium]|jgi:hypothetical protein